MVRHLSVIACLMLVASACGGDSKKPPPKKPVVKKKEEPPPKETEEDRAAKREKQANKLVPKSSTCIPLAFKENGAPQLELAAIGSDAVICAIDNDEDRMLGVVGCWKVDLASGEMSFRSREPAFSRGFTMKIDGKCAHELCLPKDSKVPEDRKALITSNADGTKWAMLVGDDMHIYDGEKSHEAAWGIRTDKGVTDDPTRIHWVGEHIFIESAGGIYVYKVSDGTAVGPIGPLGGKDPKPLTTKTGGSFLILDKTRVAISDQGFSTVTTYEADTGKRAKLVRRLAKSPCKPAESEAFWKGDDGDLPAKCKDHMEKNFAHLVGADAVAGSKNLLVLLRGPRLGELAVLDAKSLAEKKAIKLPWCDEESGGGDDEDEEKDEKSDNKADKKDAKDKDPKKKPTKKDDEEEEDDE